MEALRQIIENVKNLDESREFSRFMERDDARRYVIHLNTIEQLYEMGIDAFGMDLGQYREMTKMLKMDPELGHITLKETGQFYDSFRVLVTYGSFTIEADTIKNGSDLLSRWSEILGLTDFSKEKLSEYFLENGFIEQIREAILVS